MGDDKILQIIIQAKDSASSVLSQVEGNIKETASTLNSIKAKANENGEALRRMGNDGANSTNKLKSGAESTKSAFSSLGSVIKNALAYTVGYGIFDMIKTGMKSAWDMSIGYNSALQQNTIAFNTMLGSSDKAGKLLKQLSDFASATPFEFNDLTDASKKMLAFGFSSEQIMPMLKSVGDATAGLGMSGKEGLDRIILALGQTRSAGKLTGDNLRQLVEAGIPVWEILGKGFGKTTAEMQKMVSAGIVPADKGIDILIKGMEEKFPNMMDKQSKSFAGLMSTLKDNVQTTLAGILKPQFDNLCNNILPRAIEMTTRLSNAFSNGGMKGVLEELFPKSIGDTLFYIGDGISKAFGWIKDNGETVKTVVAGITGAFIAYKGALLLTTIAQEAQNLAMIIGVARTGGLAMAEIALAGAEGSATIAQMALNLAMSLNPIGIIIVAIGALVGAIIYLWTHNKAFHDFIVNAWNNIKTVVGGAINAVIAFFHKIGPALSVVWNFVVGSFITTVTLWLNIFEKLKTGVVNGFNRIVQSVSTFITNARTFLVTGWHNIVATVTSIINSFVAFILAKFSVQINAIRSIFSSLINIFQNIWNIIKNVFLGAILIIIDIFTGNFGKLKSDALHIMQNIWQSTQQVWASIANVFIQYLTIIATTVKQVLTAIWNVIVSIWNAVVGYIAGVLQNVWNIIVTSWTSIFNAISSIVSNIKAWIISTWDSIVNWFSTLPGRLYSAGVAMFNSFRSAVVSGIASAREAIINGINNAISWIQSLPGRLHSAGVSMINGLKSGISGAIGGIRSIISSGVESAISFLSGIPSRMFSWGADMIHGLTSGIQSTIGSVVSAVSGIGDTIRSYLHFSVPDQGPLTDYESWMPDFVKGMANGINANKYLLTDAVKGMAGDVKVGVAGTTKKATATNTNTKTQQLPPQQHFHIDKFIVQDKGDEKRTLQQLQFLTATVGSY